MVAHREVVAIKCPISQRVVEFMIIKDPCGDLAWCRTCYRVFLADELRKAAKLHKCPAGPVRPV